MHQMRTALYSARARIMRHTSSKNKEAKWLNGILLKLFKHGSAFILNENTAYQMIAKILSAVVTRIQIKNGKCY